MCGGGFRFRFEYILYIVLTTIDHEVFISGLREKPNGNKVEDKEFKKSRDRGNGNN